MRFAACVEYLGSRFSGWQAQKQDVRTVQECVEYALSKVADAPVSIITAGRTDTGVHATGQIIHFDSNAKRSNFAWVRGGNTHLPSDVRILWVQPVSSEFHARFSAVSRSYRYIIYNNFAHSAIHNDISTFEYRELNAQDMRNAGKELLGEHDFSSFRAAGCQAKSPVRTVLGFSLNQYDKWIWFDIRANAFLQHMVRNIAGVLIEIGCGERPVSWINEVLNHKDRTKGGITALPNGLYLTGVEYPDEFNIRFKPKLVSFWNNE